MQYVFLIFVHQLQLWHKWHLFGEWNTLPGTAETGGGTDSPRHRPDSVMATGRILDTTSGSNPSTPLTSCWSMGKFPNSQSLGFLIYDFFGGVALWYNSLSWVVQLGNNEYVISEPVKLLSHVQLFAIPWTVAHQAPPSMEFSRQEYWSGLPFPSPHSTSFIIYI